MKLNKASKSLTYQGITCELPQWLLLQQQSYSIFGKIAIRSLVEQYGTSSTISLSPIYFSFTLPTTGVNCAASVHITGFGIAEDDEIVFYYSDNTVAFIGSLKS